MVCIDDIFEEDQVMFLKASWGMQFLSLGVHSVGIRMQFPTLPDQMINKTIGEKTNSERMLADISYYGPV